MSIVDSLAAYRAQQVFSDGSDEEGDQSFFQEINDREIQKRDKYKLKTTQELEEDADVYIKSIEQFIQTYREFYITKTENVARQVKARVASEQRSPSRSDYLAIYNERKYLRDYHERLNERMLRLKIAREIKGNLSLLEQAQRSRVYSSQLITCQLCLPSEVPYVSEEVFKEYHFFYMEKICTLNGKKYLDKHIFKVKAFPESYDFHYGDDQNYSLDLSYYENLEHAKTNFLANNKNIVNGLAEEITEEAIKAKGITHEVAGPVKHNFLRFLRLKYQDEHGKRLLFSKYVSINKIVYIVSDEINTNGTKIEEDFLQKIFMRKPLSLADKCIFLQENYRSFDFMGRLIDEELDLMLALTSHNPEAKKLQYAEEFLKYVMGDSYYV